MRKALSLAVATLTVMSLYFTTVTVCNTVMYYFDLDRVHFLHGSLYHAVFWICVESSVVNVGMF